MSERTAKISSFAPGLNNRLEPTQLDVTLGDRSKATYLWGADNVDLNDKGYLKRRRGQTLTAAGRSHSLWSDALGALVVIDGALTALADAPLGFSRTTVRQGLPKLPLSYSRGADGAVYWSNGQDLRRIVAGADLPVHTPGFDLAPMYGPMTGALAPGSYLIACTVRGEGGESPASTVERINLPNGGGIAVVAQGAFNVYMSAADGDVLTLQGTGDVLTHHENGRICETLNTALMPAGSVVRHYQGRLLVAQGNVLYFSRPYQYGVYDPSAGYIPFPAPITVIEPTDNGFYICADKAYWLVNFDEATLQMVLPYGAIAGTSGRTPTGDQVFWQTPRGLVMADKNQGVKNVQEEALEFSAASSGASLFRERDGMTHVVTSRAGVQPSQAAAQSFMHAEVIRQGTVL